MLNTPENNKIEYSQRNIKGYDTDRAMYGKTGYPSLNDYKNTVRMKLIRTFPVTINNIEIDEDIWEKNIGAL